MIALLIICMTGFAFVALALWFDDRDEQRKHVERMAGVTHEEDEE
jgi:hypothetical protein